MSGPEADGDLTVALLSGGLDSTVAAALAREAGHRLLALTINYGQRHRIELAAARRAAATLGAERHVVLPIDLTAFGGSALTDAIPVPKSGVAPGIPPTYVPARNTVFLSLALAWAEAAGARTQLFGGAYLAALPLYLAPGSDAAAREMVEAVREAEGVVLASPGYHGSISGTLKNAIDYLEATARDPRPYLDGLPVGLIVTAYGWQATGGTLATLRVITHALRGWPTPMGATLNTSAGLWDAEGRLDEGVDHQLTLVGRQVTQFALLRRREAVAMQKA